MSMLRRTAGEAGDSIPTRAPTSTGLHVLFDVGHPDQVHLFRHAIEELHDRGHETFVTSRETAATVDLLDALGIDHLSLTTGGDSKGASVRELLASELRLLHVARRFRPDVIVSRFGPVPAHVSALVGCRYVAVGDPHIDRTIRRWIYHHLTFPFVDTICVPRSVKLPIAAGKCRPLDFQGLAYLHPDRFQPDPDVLAEYDIDPEEPLFVIHLAGLDRSHDVESTSLSSGTIRRLAEMLSDHGQVFITAENDLPPDLAAYRLRAAPDAIHHVLYYADLLVGDSRMMSTEAAMLGTPAIRTITTVGNVDNVSRELEERYDLLRSYDDEDQVFRAVERILAAGIDRVDWRARRDRMIAEQADPTGVIVETILESAPDEEPITIDND